MYIPHVASITICPANDIDSNDDDDDDDDTSTSTVFIIIFICTLSCGEYSTCCCNNLLHCKTEEDENFHSIKGKYI